MSDPILQLQGVTCGYGGTPVLSGLDLTVRAGTVCALLGPNGVGKTTLFKSILGSLPLLGGTVLVEGRDAATLSRTQMARALGYVPQAHTPPFPYTVAEVVEMGRTAHLPLTAAPSRADRQLALEALNRMGIAHLHDRPYTEVSGGERQLILIARALCQQARLLIMDEPCASLDFGNRARVLREVRALADDGMAVLMTTHDPDHALTAADQVVVVLGDAAPEAGSPDQPAEATQYVVGRPAEVITPQLLERLYGIPAAIGEVAGRPAIVAL